MWALSSLEGERLLEGAGVGVSLLEGEHLLDDSMTSYLSKMEV